MAPFLSVLNVYKEMQWFVLHAAEFSLNFWIVTSIFLVISEINQQAHKTALVQIKCI